MVKYEPWDDEGRFSPDNRLSRIVSLGEKLIQSNKRLDSSKMDEGLQSFVDAIGELGSSAADVVSRIGEGERQKAEDVTRLNEVQAEGRQSYIQDTRIREALSHQVREQDNRGLYNEVVSLDIANKSHELANRLGQSTVDYQEVITEEKVQQIRARIEERVSQAKGKASSSALSRLSGLNKGQDEEVRGLVYQKATEGDASMVDARLGFPSSVLKPEG